MKRFLLSTAAVLALSVSAFAGSIDYFNLGTNPDVGNGYGYIPPYTGAPDPRPAAPTKYDEELFNGANGATVSRRTEKGWTGGENADVASAQCDFSLGTLNSPSFGKCPKERPGERVLDKDGTNYSSPVREVYTIHSNDIWHTDQSSGGD